MRMTAPTTPFEKITEQDWEVLICMDGERISLEDYYRFEDPEYEYEEFLTTPEASL
jgi:hypothetical protein